MGKQENNLAAYRVDTESGLSDSSSAEVVTAPVKTWKGYIWDTWELPKEERRLLFKLDAFILTFASVRGNDSIYILLCSCDILVRILPKEPGPV